MRRGRFPLLLLAAALAIAACTAPPGPVESYSIDQDLGSQDLGRFDDGPTAFDQAGSSVLPTAAEGADVTNGPAKARAVDLGASDLGELVVSQDSVSRLIDAPQPGIDLVVRTVDDDSLFPDRKEIETALTTVDQALTGLGLEGLVRLFAGGGLVFYGHVPGFSDPVDIQASVNSEGAVRWLAERDLATMSLLEEDLPSDYPVGGVWLGERVAYGHGVGPGAEEWAAFDLGDEFFLIRTHHFAGTDSLLGMEAFIEKAAQLVDTVRSAGFTISVESEFAAEHWETSALFRTAATLRCAPNAPNCKPLGIIESQN